MLIEFGIGAVFGVFMATVLYYRSPSFFKMVCSGLDNFYKRKRKSKGGINLENWRQ